MWSHDGYARDMNLINRVYGEKVLSTVFSKQSRYALKVLSLCLDREQKGYSRSKRKGCKSDQHKHQK